MARDSAGQYQIIHDDTKRGLANPGTRRQSLALSRILMDLNRSIMAVWEMRADDPQSELKYEELSLKARPLQEYLNDNRTALTNLRSAVNAMVASKRRRDYAKLMVEHLYPVASKYLTFDQPPAHLQAVSSIPPAPSLAVS
ncbi:MAG: hypothetical protein ACYC44_00225 [Patescibacteria group bacterium]